MKNHNALLGLSSLLLFIPAPTLIFSYSRSLAENGIINFLDMTLAGSQAQLLLFTLSLIGISLLAISLRELGGILNNNF